MFRHKKLMNAIGEKTRPFAERNSTVHPGDVWARRETATRRLARTWTTMVGQATLRGIARARRVARSEGRNVISAA